MPCSRCRWILFLLPSLERHSTNVQIDAPNSVSWRLEGGISNIVVLRLYEWTMPRSIRECSSKAPNSRNFLSWFEMKRRTRHVENWRVVLSGNVTCLHPAKCRRGFRPFVLDDCHRRHCSNRGDVSNGEILEVACWGCRGGRGLDVWILTL